MRSDTVAAKPISNAALADEHAAVESPVGMSILAALENWDSTALAAAIDRDPADPVLSRIFVKGLQGTLHYRALDYAMLMANSGANFEHVVGPALACAKVLMLHRAPVHFLSTAPAAAAMLFFDTDWSGSIQAARLGEVLRTYIRFGLVSTNEPLPPHNAVGGLVPLAAIAKIGNPVAAAALLEFDVDLDAPLRGTRFTDILALIRSFNTPQSGAIAAMVAEKLMRVGLESNDKQSLSLPGVRRRLGV